MGDTVSRGQNASMQERPGTGETTFFFARKLLLSFNHATSTSRLYIYFTNYDIKNIVIVIMFKSLRFFENCKKRCIIINISFVFLYRFLVDDIIFLDFTDPHVTWHDCSPTWLIQNVRFVSLGVHFPLCQHSLKWGRLKALFGQQLDKRFIKDYEIIMASWFVGGT